MCLYVRRFTSQESLTLTRWLRQSRSTVKMRRAQLIAFSGQGMRARQIAEHLGMHEEYMRELIRRVYTATYASWMNRIECHFAPFRRFVLDNSDWRDHSQIARAVQDYLRWRNREKRNPNILKEQNSIRTL